MLLNKTRLLDFFDHAYLINLPCRKDRRKRAMKELERMGLSSYPGKAEIFPAIRPSEASPFSSVGARGCFLSHYGVLKQAQTRGFESVLIMEDDSATTELFYKNEGMLVKQLQQTDWGFVYFGHVLGEKTPEQDSSIVALKPFLGGIRTTSFYGVRGKIFDRLIFFLEEVQKRPPGDPKGGPMHIDGAFSVFRKQNPDLITLVATPSVGYQRSSSSDIPPQAMGLYTGG